MVQSENSLLIHRANVNMLSLLTPGKSLKARRQDPPPGPAFTLLLPNLPSNQRLLCWLYVGPEIAGIPLAILASPETDVCLVVAALYALVIYVIGVEEIIIGKHTRI